uniref:Uncharacterized protein n=1 Tax=Tanacetum cinerariifolium TaxID=118510 RepID=A0A6L2NL03_TANCI|nr:hypothetical protein [Tanacetum cinerariifolium]
MLQLPVIEKNVTESLKADVLTRSSSQPQSSYETTTTLFEFKLTKILINKMKKNKSFDVADYKRELHNALVKSYNTGKDIFELYGEVFPLKRSRDDKDKDQDPFAESDRETKRRKSKEPSHTVEDSGMQQDQEFIMKEMMNNPLTRRLPKLTGSRNLSDIGTCKSITELEYHLEECSKATTERLDWHNPENKLVKIIKKYDYSHLEKIEDRRDDQELYTFKKGDFKRLRLQDIEDMLLLLIQQRLTNLIINERYDLNVALRMYSRRIVIQRNKTTYTSHSDPHGIIYVDQFKRKKLMRDGELHKFSDGTLNGVRSALYDIAAGIRMEYPADEEMK